MELHSFGNLLGEVRGRKLCRAGGYENGLGNC
jgi:hypothetical protein